MCTYNYTMYVLAAQFFQGEISFDDRFQSSSLATGGSEYKTIVEGVQNLVSVISSLKQLFSNQHTALSNNNKFIENSLLTINIDS